MSDHAATVRTDPSAAPGTSADDLGRREAAWGLALLLGIVGILRLLPLLAHDWTLGDGGLFYTMVGDLIASGFALPAVTSYQAGAIPFAYPPLALYAVAALESATGVERIEFMRWWPAAAAVASVGAACLVATEVVPSRRHALVSAAFYAALIGPATLLTSGGGLTRSSGVLLGLLAVWQGLRMLRTGHRSGVAATAVLAGLAVLAHPEAGLTVLIALGAAWLTRYRNARSMVRLMVAATGALVVQLPWLVAVIGAHGLGPLTSAATVPDRALVDAVLAYGYLFLLLLILPTIGLLDLLGQVQQLLARRFQLLAWRIGLFAVDLRFSSISAALPVSMLASHGLLDVLLPATWSVARRWDRLGSERGRQGWRRALVTVVLAIAFIPTVLGALAHAEPGIAVSAGARAAMRWVATEAPASAVTASLATASWGSDHVSEWFPALSGRPSVTTYQGLEWAGERFEAQREADARLRSCQAQVEVAACVDRWIGNHPQRDRIVLYVDRSALPDAAGLVADLEAEHGYVRLWESDDGWLLSEAVPVSRAR